jgi:putative chitinase
LIQITGRANYEAFGKARGVDYTRDTNTALLAVDPATAIESACWFWQTRSLNSMADRDDLVAITHKLNGGMNGLLERSALLARAKFFIGSVG